jgi:hypothetical protein
MENIQTQNECDFMELHNLYPLPLLLHRLKQEETSLKEPTGEIKLIILKCILIK